MSKARDNHEPVQGIASLEARFSAPIVVALKRDWPMKFGFVTAFAAIAGTAFGLADHISDGNGASRGEMGRIRTELRVDIGDLETRLRDEICNIQSQVQTNVPAQYI